MVVNAHGFSEFVLIFCECKVFQSTYVLLTGDVLFDSGVVTFSASSPSNHCPFCALQKHLLYLSLQHLFVAYTNDCKVSF